MGKRCKICETPEKEIVCEKCGKHITDDEFFCIDATGGADDLEHFHLGCFDINSLKSSKVGD